MKPNPKQSELKTTPSQKLTVDAIMYAKSSFTAITNRLPTILIAHSMDVYQLKSDINYLFIKDCQCKIKDGYMEFYGLKIYRSDDIPEGKWNIF